MRATEESLRLNVNYEVVDQSLSGSGFAIFNADQSSVATGSSELNIFDFYPLPCSEPSIRGSDLTCVYGGQDDGEVYPNPVFEGTEMFASFRSLPDY